MRALLLFCFCVWFVGQAEAQQLVVPSDWQPSLAFVRQELETQIKEGAKSPETVVRLTNRLPEIADAELFLVYVRLYERSSPSDREALRREQGRWQKAYAQYAVDHVIFGDSAAVVAGLRATIRFIDQRTEKLRHRLSRLPRPPA